MKYLTTAFAYTNLEVFKFQKSSILQYIIDNNVQDNIFSPCFLSSLYKERKITAIGALVMEILSLCDEVIVLGDARTKLLDGEIALATQLEIPVTFLSIT